MAQNQHYVCERCKVPIVRAADALVLEETIFTHGPGTVIKMANRTVEPLTVAEDVFQFQCPVRKVNVKNVNLRCSCGLDVGIFYFRGDATKTDPRQYIYHVDVNERLLFAHMVELAP